MKYSLWNYIKQFKDISFHQRPFQQVDALLLSQLAYLKMDRVIPGFGCRDYPTLRDLHALPEKEQLFTDPVYGAMYRRIFEQIWDSRRYGQIRIAYFMEVQDKEKECHFAAVSFLLGENSTFAAFRGTDETLLSWKEDLNLSCMDTIPSQSMALCYLKGVARNTLGRIVTGGHSKGGNLAIYASARVPQRIQNRISRVYSFDGVGFRQKFYQDPGYQRIRDRIFKLIPRQSTIGLIFPEAIKERIVQSYKKGFQQHDLMNWKIRGGKFQYCKTLKLSSRRFGKRINKWIDSLSDRELSELINIIFELLGADQSQTVYELKPKEIASRFIRYLLSSGDEIKYQLLQIAGTLVQV